MALVLLAVILAVITLAVYIVGVTPFGDAPAASAAFGRTPEAPNPQPATIPAAGVPSITVSGIATVAGTPDTLRLDLSVVATAASVSDALASANRSAEAVHDALLKGGVETKDLQTSGLSISPQYDYANGAAPRLTGYQATQNVSAKLRDLGGAGATIGKAVAAGGDAVRVDGVSLDLEASGTLLSSARDKAFADAKTKAEQYARAAGRTLGDVVSISEDTAGPSPAPMQSARKAQALSASAPIQPGSQDVSLSVTVVFSMR